MSTVIDITDEARAPTLAELCGYIANPLFTELYDYLTSELKALYSIAYSGDNVLLGWNIRLHKSGRTLCRIYPREGGFKVLVVIGKKEKERVEALLPELSDELREIYNSTAEGMGQRWLILDFTRRNALFDDLLRLVKIRRESK